MRRALIAGAVLLAVGVAGFAIARNARQTSCRSDPAPTSGGIREVTASSSSGRRLYVTTNTRTLYRSDDDGRHWWKSRTRLPGPVIESLGRRKDTLFADTNTGLYRSEDGGRSWRALSCWGVSEVAGWPPDSRILYVGTYASLETGRGGGLYRTGDGGKTWERFTRFPVMGAHSRDVNVVVVNPRNPYAVYVGLEFGGVQVSADGGEHWRFHRIKDEKPFLFGPQLTDLAFGPGRRPTLWAGSRSQGVFRRDGGAATWVALGLRGRDDVSIVADQRNPRIAYVLKWGGRILRTLDNGAHWKPLDLAGVVGLTVQPKTNALYAWSGSAIFRSRDAGESWTRLAPLPR